MCHNNDDDDSILDSILDSIYRYCSSHRSNDGDNRRKFRSETSDNMDS